ncbi:MAG TPA: cupin domain-containing protein [Candidatus Acidoferrum sp.]|jgi:DNA-binding transcriptional MerR regulator/quercetin dioxygenase-like cupin family protein|nr:cupin domain-containing protein [Candidatus Acidoferrum sp.]
MSSRKNLSGESAKRAGRRPLRISEVARRLGISSSALRAWEALGLVTPQRTESRYRLYAEKDVRLLQRAIFLRRARGLNPAAIVHVLKRQGVVSAPAETSLHPGQRFRRLRVRRGLSLAQVARATGVSVGFLSALERGQMRSSIATLRRIARFYRTNILSLFETAGDNPRLVRPNQRKILETTSDVRMELLAWGNTVMEPHLFRVKPGGGSGESYSHEGEEFLHVLRGKFEIWLDGKEHYNLRPGDSLYFESSTPHRWKNPGRAETWLLWINTPPTF